MKIKNIAVLITCFNRKSHTINCLGMLFKVDVPPNYSLDIYLVDDGSTDGTSNAVKKYFPNVNVIKGNGNLYWNGGMRLAWKNAIDCGIAYDYFLWLNDDTNLFKNALTELFEVVDQIKIIKGEYPIVTGACQESTSERIFSYGGRNYDDSPVVPTGEFQKCTRINGNIVLIPSSVYKQLGVLSDKYTHAMGDYDYSARAENRGISTYTTRTYIATCKTNKITPTWCNPTKPIIERWKNFHHPLGLNINEYQEFLKVNKRFWRIEIIKVYIKLLIPSIYSKLVK